MQRRIVMACRVPAAAVVALLAVSCGRSLTLDDRPGIGGSGAGGSSLGDAGNTAGAGGAGGASGATGFGGSLGTGGAQVPPVDAGNDRPPDASPDVIDAHTPDLASDHTSPPDVGGCPADCTKLPHVRAGAYAPCVNGVCNLNYGACEVGFDHCSTVSNIGCETDLSASPNCGSCNQTCFGDYLCKSYGAGYTCALPCAAPTPDECGISCVDLQSEPYSCGTCQNSCFVPNTLFACQQGHCVTLGCTDSTVADCTADPGCETTLGNDPDCGGCNDPACTLANTMFSCSDGLGCKASVCELGFANCDTTGPDCETAFAMPSAASAGCLPSYGGSVGLATQLLNTTVTAIAPDGSFFIAGTYQGAVDFDPSSAGKDVQTASDSDGYVSKFHPDGSYAWTATLTGRGDLTLNALAVTPAGGVVAAGSYDDTIDLDPSAAQDIHVTNETFASDPYVVELNANGAEVWGRTFAGASFESGGTSKGVTVDAAGAVYVTGSFSGTFDFGAGAGNQTYTSLSDYSAGFLVKLASTGARAWSQFVDDVDCGSSLQAVAVATTGSAWAAGTVTATTTGCVLAAANGFTDALILKVGAGGDTSTTWRLGDGQAQGAAIAAGLDGAVYVGGVGSGDIDLDPGPAVARRWLAPANWQAAFVLKLSADGAYQWSRVLPSASIAAMASAPNGGVIAGGANGQAFVTRLTANGDSVWTFPIGDSSVTLTAVATSATAFTVAGISSGTQDFDPGPGIDLVFGDVAFVSRFNF